MVKFLAGFATGIAYMSLCLWIISIQNFHKDEEEIRKNEGRT